MIRMISAIGWTGRHRPQRWALAALFLLAFLPRAIYPVSRPLQWYFRSAEFFQAILRGDPAGTLFSEHPGVTVMWLSGAALWGWYGLQTLLGLGPPAPLETEGFAFADRVAVGVVPLALVVALGIIWGWVLLRRLFGPRVAWIAALLWALDPFFLANSKVLHLDATLSTLMLLSALWMLLYLRERRVGQLALSGLLGGLAILTKVSALFLIPFLGLCLIVDWLLSLRDLRNRRSAISELPSLARDILMWIGIAAAICYLLWPSLWVQPRESLDVVIRQGILLHAGGPRDQPLFYRGELGVQDPGLRFYLDTILFRTTFLTLPFAALGLGLGLITAGARRRETGLSLLLLTGFAIFYVLQMSLGGWKDGRYMLPVLLALDVLAAWGLAWWVDRLPLRRGGRWIVVGLLMIQAALVFSHHPYYGTHYNELAGGPRAALRVFPPAEFGEGLDRAGRYVDGLPGAGSFTVGTQFLANEMVAQHVRAPVYDVAQVGQGVDSLIFGVQYTTRGPDYPRWGKLWEQTYKFREPAFVASFDGIPYAWVHQPDARPVIPRWVDTRLGESVRLRGYRLAEQEMPPGGTLLVTLYWQAERAVAGDYTVFVHLQAPDGSLVAQQDNPPVRATRPTGGWAPGALIEDPYEIELPREAAPGDYVLSAGMYDPAMVERLPVFGPDGTRLRDDRLILTTVRVRRAIPGWRWALAGAWLAVVAAGGMWRPRSGGGSPAHEA